MRFRLAHTRGAPLTRRLLCRGALRLELTLVLLFPFRRRAFWVSVVRHLHGRHLVADGRLVGTLVVALSVVLLASCGRE